ncbi:MAG: GatB/YqeY domain-containing protein [Alphaproteobacteria bacterium]
MLREQLNERLKEFMRARDSESTGALRMVLAAIKQRDIDARPKGVTDGISDSEIITLMQGMIKQRRESMALYHQGGRPELADKEEREITLIEQFLPKMLSEEEITTIVKTIISETGAVAVKDMGKVMGALKSRYADGSLDMTIANKIVKEALTA